MRAVLITVGDEILGGQIVNRDFAIVSRRLSERGVSVIKEVTVPDRKEDISGEIKKALEIADLVLTSGGLGPTPDDVTREAVADALGRKLVFSKEVYDKVIRRLEEWGLSVKDAHRKYGFVIEGFEVIDNDAGLAPGMMGEVDGKKILILPGPPRELESVLDKVLDRIAGPVSERSLTRRIKTFGLRETEIYELLNPLRDVLEPLGYYPSIYGVEIEIRASGDPGEAEEELHFKEEKIREVLGDNVYGVDGDTLEAVLGRILREKKLTLATAESCTGGLVGNLITDVPGSSDYYLGGVVAYHNDVKMKLLGVSEATLRKFGAVSELTARQMAEGVRKLIGADVGLSTTGIAGPTGGTPEKPVGLVYMAVAMEGKTRVIKRIFRGNRLEVKKQSAYTVIDLARREILSVKNE